MLIPKKVKILIFILGFIVGILLLILGVPEDLHLMQMEGAEL